MFMDPFVLSDVLSELRRFFVFVHPYSLCSFNLCLISAALELNRKVIGLLQLPC